MFTNYLKIALRGLLKHKVFAFINVGGLALGLSVSLLILLYVAHEVSYDRFHKNYDRIFRVHGLVTMGEMQINIANMSARLGDALREATPSVQLVGRKSDEGEVVMETDRNHRYTETGLIFADAGFFQIFNFRILQGNVAALARPYTVFLTPDMARKYFGTQNPLGKTIRWNKKTDLEVVGLVEKNPSNSSITYNFVASLPTRLAVNKAAHPDYYTDAKLNRIGPGDYETFLLLDQPQNSPNVERALRRLASQNPDNQNITLSINDFADHLGLQSGTPNQLFTYVSVFLVIALLILLLALINFMNLTTARANVRAKEVGIRKSVGAGKGALATQFYLESTLTVLLALGLSLLLFQLLKPLFFTLLDSQIDTSFLVNPYYLGAFGGVVLLSILLAGSYPALVLSRFNPALVLKGVVKNGSSVGLRKGLTVFQLTVSTTLILCLFVIYGQINSMRKRDLGLTKDQVLTISLDGAARTRNQALLSDLRQVPGVVALSGAGNRLFYEGFNMYGVHKLGDKTQNNVGTIIFSVDSSFIDLFRMQWLRKPVRLPADLTNQVVLNESAARALGGNLADLKQVDMGTDGPVEVLGVVKDFQYVNPRNQIMPLLFQFITDPQKIGFVNLKIAQTADVAATVQAVEAVYNRYKVEEPFTYTFADEAFDRMFKAEDRLSGIFGVFTAIAIFIACLGLFGLATFTAEQRTKEIGVRKVLGASVSSLVVLLNKEFLKLVLIALLLASPLAWWAMNQWLQDFVYRIEIEWWVFALAGLLAVGIALLTVSFQSVRAALMNPVKSLRSE
ncbi:MAG: ABC transporter permease [Cytophagales bacterium]|nr:MAG: ABC transporter permease [Cytophagales bacterium]